MLKRFKTDQFGNYELPFNIFAEGDGGGGGGGEGEGGEGGDAPVPFTLGDTLPVDMMDEAGAFPKSLLDFTSVVIPGADKDNSDHQIFHSKVGSLAKAYADTKSMVGSMIKIPGEDASREEISAYRAKLGVPATPADYEAKMPDIDSAKLLLNDDTLAKFKTIAHGKGYTNDQVQSALDFQVEMFTDQIKEMDTKAADGMKTLQTELGDKYETAMKGAEMMVQKYFPEAAQATIAASLGNDPDFVRGMMGIFEATKEDGDLLGMGGDSTRDASVKAIESEVNELMSSKEYAKMDPRTHKKVGELIERKQKMLGTFKANVTASKK